MTWVQIALKVQEVVVHSYGGKRRKEGPTEVYQGEKFMVQNLHPYAAYMTFSLMKYLTRVYILGKKERQALLK